MICIIPARGGSKRIPKKNIKEFLGRPIISYPIKTAIESDIFDEVCVYTDDKEIAYYAEKYGAKYLERPEVDDGQTLADAITGCDRIKQHKDICVILPTAVFFTIDDLKKAKEIYGKGVMQSICTVMYEGEQPESGRDSRGRLFFKMPFRDAGQFYMTRRFSLKEYNSLVNDAWPYEIDSVDINTQEDWDDAERRYAGILARKVR